MIDAIAAIVQPIGHAHHMPVEPSTVFERRKANPTRSIRSVKVAIINCFINPDPLKIPSATSFAEITK